MSRTRDWCIERSVVVNTTLYVSRIASKTSTQRIPDWRAMYTGQSGSSMQWMTISVRPGSAADLFRSGTLSGREPRWPSVRMISSTSRAKSNFSFPFERWGSKGRSFQCNVAGGVLGLLGPVERVSPRVTCSSDLRTHARCLRPEGACFLVTGFEVPAVVSEKFLFQERRHSRLGLAGSVTP